KVHAGQVVEHQRDPLGKALLVELLFDRHPSSVEFIHGLIEVILLEILAGLVQPTGGGQERASGVIDQGQLGAGKEDAAKDHGLEQTGVAAAGHRAEESLQTKFIPSLVQNRQAAEATGLGQLQAVRGNKAL